MTLDELIITKCCVCEAIELGGIWYNKLYAEWFNFGNEVIKYSHTYCSPECISIGTGMSIKESKEVYNTSQKLKL